MKRPFFILAACWAILGPAIFMWSFFNTSQHGLTVREHGAGMLFGFASALIAAYLGGKRLRCEVWWLMLLWGVSRVTEIVGNGAALGMALNGLFGLHLGAVMAPRFWSSKQIRNRMLTPLLALLMIAPTCMMSFHFAAVDRSGLIMVYGQLLAMLMFFMAGRVIAALRTQSLNEMKLPRKVHTQPKLEVMVMAMFSMTVLIQFFALLSASQTIHQLLAIVQGIIGLLILIRVIRWRPDQLKAVHAPLWCLVVGYVWLVLSQLSLAKDAWVMELNPSSLHLVTVGALGLFSSAIMSLQVSKKQPLRPVIYWCYIFFICAASGFRLLAAYVTQWAVFWLIFSTFCWIMNYTLVLWVIIKPRLLPINH